MGKSSKSLASDNPSSLIESSESNNIRSTPKLRYATKSDKNEEGSSSIDTNTTSEDDREVSKKQTVVHRFKLYGQNQVSKNLFKLRKYKWIAHVLDRFDRMSPRSRKLAICLVILMKLLWKMLAVYLIFYSGLSGIFTNRTYSGSLRNFNSTNGVSVQRQLPLDMYSNATSSGQQNQNQPPPFRILHIVTSLAQYNSGQRSTVKGQDRLVEVMIPALKGAVNSIMKQPNWSIDVYLILGFNLSPSRRKIIEKALPKNVGLEVWNDATPYGYDEITANHFHDDVKVARPVTRGLARQHRYVILDKLEHYDFFTSFEDDMRITSSHIGAFMDMTQKIEQIKKTSTQGSKRDKMSKSINGLMTKTQLEHVIPGFFRVEVLLDGALSQQEKDPIPVDLVFDDMKQTVNPNYCCAVPKSEQPPDTKTILPLNPQPEQLITWETAISGFSVHKFPDPIGWAGFLPGTKGLTSGQVIPSYWSGTGGSLGDKKRPGDGQLFGQQGGFMATRQQIKDMNRLCPGGFLPPFQEPAFFDEGLKDINVETWSGGFQLFTGGIRGCNFQRIVPLDPDAFSKFLLYHTANNKQKQVSRKRVLRVETLLGQLNYVKKVAESKL